MAFFSNLLVEFVEGEGVFEVDAEADYGGRASGLVVAGIGYVLVVGGNGDTSVEMGGVVGFEDFFVAVGEATVTEYEALSA